MGPVVAASAWASVLTRVKPVAGHAALVKNNRSWLDVAVVGAVEWITAMAAALLRGVVVVVQSGPHIVASSSSSSSCLGFGWVHWKGGSCGNADADMYC